MVVHWEVTDIVSGLLVSNSATDAANNRYMVSKHVRTGKYTLVALSDGLGVVTAHDRRGMALKLNEGNYVPSSHREVELRNVMGRGY